MNDDQRNEDRENFPLSSIFVHGFALPLIVTLLSAHARSSKLAYLSQLFIDGPNVTVLGKNRHNMSVRNRFRQISVRQ